MRFEFLVAVRYLKAKRKQAAISLITLISIVGVAAGVAALIIALAINAGTTEDLQNKLLGAQAHVSILHRDRTGIADYLELTRQTEQVPGVVAAAPSLYQTVLISSNTANHGVVIKGIIPEMESRMSALSSNIVQGSLKDFGEDSVVIGKELANAIGAFVGDEVVIVSSEPTISPIGSMPTSRAFKVVAIFSSGLYDLDATWVYAPLHAVQRLLHVNDVVRTIEVKIADIWAAKQIGAQIVAKLGGNLDYDDWMSLNKAIFQALQLERVVMFITIGLIVIVAALNIVAMLVMMVLEKTRDIAILMSMGATQENIRRVFILQGVVIGVIGAIAGVILGNGLSIIADRFHLISLPADVYSIAYVPFHPRVADSLMVAASAILVSFLATLYPSAAASRLRPVEALRYE
jgi:lipoprotein-releasing system permease protein